MANSASKPAVSSVLSQFKEPANTALWVGLAAGMTALAVQGVAIAGKQLIERGKDVVNALKS